MARTMFGKVVRVGRAAIFVVGLAMVLALVFGVATTALGATGGNFILGKANVAGAVSKLTASVSGSALQIVNNGAGTALDLRVGSSTTAPADKTAAPMKVDSQARVANLNADRLDGKDSTAFLTAEIYKVSATSEEIQPGFGRGVQVFCDAGDVALSGGYHDINANLKVYADMRVEENTDPERGAVHPSGWLVSGSNPPDGGMSGLLEVQAYCADRAPLHTP
jgi:hypothetical protein